MKEYIGKTFEVKGLADTREVKIIETYLLGGQKRYPAFKCEVIKSKLNEGIGSRENFLARDIIRNGSLVSSIKVLAR